MTQWVTDFGAIFAETFAAIDAVRTANSLPALSYDPNGLPFIGREWLSQNYDAPRIVIVPIGGPIGAVMQASNAGATDYEIGSIPLRKNLYKCQHEFEAHIWGEPDPQFLNAPTSKVGSLVYDFNSTFELMREFISALQQSMTIPTGHPLSFEWDQPTDINRRGRLLVLKFAVMIPILYEPFTILPYAPASGGVTVEATVEIGSSSVGPIIIPTP